MIKRMIIMLVAVAVLGGLVYGFEIMRAKGIAAGIGAMQGAPQTVATVVAGNQNWQPTLQAVGSLRAINGADLSLDIAGVVDQISFNSGDEVKAGTVLLRLRGEDDPAKLESLLASAQLADVTYQRDLRQLKAEAISQAVVDSDAATLRSAQAQVAQQRAVIEKKVLRAPFDGRLGIRAVDLGQYLAVGTVVVTLQQLDPIYVDFTLPEQSLSSLKIGQTVDLGVDAFPAEKFAGRLIAISPKVDSSSRNVQVRAKFDNGDHKLVPGMYAKVAVLQGEPKPQITLPSTAIAFNPYGATVYIIDGSGKNAQGEGTLIARQTFVTTGASRGDQIAVLTGVKAGDQVVTAGQLKLRNGAAVVVNNKILPSDSATPSTPDN